MDEMTENYYLTFYCFGSLVNLFQQQQAAVSSKEVQKTHYTWVVVVLKYSGASGTQRASYFPLEWWRPKQS